jgi:hypothetical protein
MESPPISIAPMIQQVHLSLTSDPTTVVVDFVSSGAGTNATCSYGASPATLTTVPATVSTRFPSAILKVCGLEQFSVASEQAYYDFAVSYERPSDDFNIGMRYRIGQSIINDPMVREAYLASTFRGDEFD